MARKGILLAGGHGSRLYPLTLGVTKQLLPVYNKPLIYYPLSILLLSGIREILVIAMPHDLPGIQRLLGTGEQLGIELSYASQPQPNGIPEAFLIGKEFIGSNTVCLILGDNLFYGHHLTPLLKQADQKQDGATLFGYSVKDPNRYGVVEFDALQQPCNIHEKPLIPPSSIAVTGLYFYDHHVVSFAEKLQPSKRGELEISDINRMYLQAKNVSFQILGRGYTWLDAGTYESLMQASQFVQVIEERQGYYIASVEEIAYRHGWISEEQLMKLSTKMEKSPYSDYLKALIDHREGVQ